MSFTTSLTYLPPSLSYTSFQSSPLIPLFLSCTESRFQEALACAQSYLLFHAGDEFMTDNVEYYQEVLGHSAAPREVRVLWIEESVLTSIHLAIIYMAHERMKTSVPSLLEVDTTATFHTL